VRARGCGPMRADAGRLAVDPDDVPFHPPEIAVALLATTPSGIA
jgi:hypothetical protein